MIVATEALKKILEKCDILLEDELISKLFADDSNITKVILPKTLKQFGEYINGEYRDIVFLGEMPAQVFQISGFGTGYKNNIGLLGCIGNKDKIGNILNNMVHTTNPFKIKYYFLLSSWNIIIISHLGLFVNPFCETF